MSFHRRVSLFILIDDDRRVLLQFKSKRTPHWHFFGGGIEGDKTLEQAVRREAREELQIELADLEYMGRFESDERKGRHEKHVFLSRRHKGVDELRGLLLEGDDLGVYSREESEKIPMSDNDRSLLRLIFDHSEDSRNV